MKPVCDSCFHEHEAHYKAGACMVQDVIFGGDGCSCQEYIAQRATIERPLPVPHGLICGCGAPVEVHVDGFFHCSGRSEHIWANVKGTLKLVRTYEAAR